MEAGKKIIVKRKRSLNIYESRSPLREIYTFVCLRYTEKELEKTKMFRRVAVSVFFFFFVKLKDNVSGVRFESRNVYVRRPPCVPLFGSIRLITADVPGTFFFRVSEEMEANGSGLHANVKQSVVFFSFILSFFLSHTVWMSV